MPRERRPFNKSAIVTDINFINKTKIAVNFLTTIYGNSPVHIANIATAQAHEDKNVLINYLNEVKDFCESTIKNIENI